MHNDSTNPQLPRRQKNTAPGEPHTLTETIRSLECHGESLVVDDSVRRSAVSSELTFPEVQAEWFDRFGIWLHADCEQGETHHEWWSRVTADAALDVNRGAA